MKTNFSSENSHATLALYPPRCKQQRSFVTKNTEKDISST